MEVKRRHRHGRWLIIAGIAVAIVLGSLQLAAPHLSARLASSLVASPLHIVPAANGLASVQVANHASGLGDATDAGQRLQMELAFRTNSAN